MQPACGCSVYKVAIVGAGFVGSTTAYSLMLNGVASHIALIDINKDRAIGEMLDLTHCMQFAHSVHIEAGDSFELVRDAAVVVLCAGYAQKKGEARTDLLEKNTCIFKNIIPQIVKHNKNCILLVVTNPLDVLTYITLKLSGFSPNKVLGSGTVLDSARLRYLMGQAFNVSPKDVTTYVLGEHGDSEFVWLSRATIAGVSIQSHSSYSLDLMNNLYKQTRSAAYEIINKKGATYYAIALVVTKIIRALLLDQRRVFTVSSLIDRDEICLSIPWIIGKNGRDTQLTLELDKSEQELFMRSCDKVRMDTKKALALL
jgi:L-lactate dehydrogenase